MVTRCFFKEQKWPKSSYNAILAALPTPYNPRERVAQQQIQVLRMLKRIGMSLGELSVLLTSAAVYVVRSSTERIDEKVLAALEWVPSSERRRRAERLI